MAQLKDLLVTGPVRMVSDVYFNKIPTYKGTALALSSDINNLTTEIATVNDKVNTLNNTTVEEWATKEAFAAELYNDFYNWLSSKAGVLAGITKNEIKIQPKKPNTRYKNSREVFLEIT